MDSFSLMLLVLVLGAFFFAAGITLWRNNHKAPREMCCGGCGYPVRGLERFDCPECGKDLREAGIFPARMSRAAFAGVLLACVGGSTVTGIFLLFLLAGTSDYTPYRPPAGMPAPTTTNPF